MGLLTALLIPLGGFLLALAYLMGGRPGQIMAAIAVAGFGLATLLMLINHG